LIKSIDDDLEFLKMQLVLSRFRIVGVQAVEIDIGDVIDQLENSEDVQYQIQQLLAQIKSAELKYDERKALLKRLQAQNVRKTAEVRRNRQTLEEFGDPKGWATQDDMVKLSELNIAIRNTKKNIASIESRIADLRQIIDLKRRKMFVETHKAKPDVLSLCDSWRVFRAVDHENARVLALNETEMRVTGTLMDKLNAQYSEEKLRELMRENRIVQEQCREFKRKFYAQRMVTGKKLDNFRDDTTGGSGKEYLWCFDCEN
jgi:hypothetical protein